MTFPYMASPLSYVLRAPRKGNARQRRWIIRRRVRIAALFRRLGGTVSIEG